VLYLCDDLTLATAWDAGRHDHRSFASASRTCSAAPGRHRRGRDERGVRSFLVVAGPMSFGQVLTVVGGTNPELDGALAPTAPGRGFRSRTSRATGCRARSRRRTEPHRLTAYNVPVSDLARRKQPGVHGYGTHRIQSARGSHSYRAGLRQDGAASARTEIWKASINRCLYDAPGSNCVFSDFSYKCTATSDDCPFQ